MKLLYSYMRRLCAYITDRLYQFKRFSPLSKDGLGLSCPVFTKVTGILPVALVCFQFVCLAQESPAGREATGIGKIKPLEIGDIIPEALWNLPLQVVNHPEGKDTITLNDYRDKKLIILDFWATWCAPCITSLNKLDTLQKEFKNQIAIIPTTNENEEKVADFFLKKDWSLPSSVKDSTLKKHFPHRSIPHQVWIKKGEVLALTGNEYGKQEYVERVLTDENVNFVHKIEVKFDKTKPLFHEGNGGDGSNMLFQSVISGRMQANVAGVSYPTPSQMLAYNQTIDQLFATAFQKNGASNLTYFNHRKYTIYDVDDSLKARINPTEIISSQNDFIIKDWAQKNTYCYNLVLPDGVSDPLQISNRMLNDLNEFFGHYLGINASYEERKVKALALVKTENFNGISSKGEESFIRWGDGRLKLTINNSPLQTLINRLSSSLSKESENESQFYNLPLVDETGIQGNIDLILYGDLSNFEATRSALNEYGLDLIEKVSSVNMIVFKYNENLNATQL